MLFLVSVDLAFDVRAIMTSKTSNRERVYLGVIQGRHHQDAKYPEHRLRLVKDDSRFILSCLR
jgi:hypothetical protein